MVEELVSRFRRSGVALGLVFFGVCSCGGSSKEHGGSGERGGAGGSDSGASGDAGLGGTSQGGTAPTGGAGSANGGSGATGGDATPGGASGNAGDSGSAGAGGDDDGGEGGGSSGAAGNGGDEVTYAACGFGSGIARTVIAKRDPERDRCVVLILSRPGSETLGLTLPASWGVEAAFMSSPVTATCLMRLPASGGISAESGTGTVTQATPFVVDVDVTLTFAGGVMESLQATGLDESPRCTL